MGVWGQAYPLCHVPQPVPCHRATPGGKGTLPGGLHASVSPGRDVWQGAGHPATSKPVLNSLFLPLSSPPACPRPPGAPPAALAVPRVAWRGPAGLRPAHPVPPIATAAWPSPPPPPPASPASPPTTPASSPRTPLIPNRLPPCPRTSPARYREGRPCCRPPCLSFLFHRMGGWCWVPHKSPVQQCRGDETHPQEYFHLCWHKGK